MIYAEVAVGFADRGQIERTLQSAGLVRLGRPASSYAQSPHSGTAARRSPKLSVRLPV